jgi:hypothetical protein
MSGTGTPTHYDVLGVRPDATQDEIRRAYHSLARRHHPDTQPDAEPSAARESGLAMAAVNDAWEVLGDPARRRDYDNHTGEGVGAGRKGADAPPGPDEWLPFHEGADDWGEDDWGEEDWEDDDHRVPLVAGGFGLVVMVPVLLVFLAAGLFFFSTMAQSIALRSLAIVLLPVAGFGFVAAPLLVMIRSRSRG